MDRFIGRVLMLCIVFAVAYFVIESSKSKKRNELLSKGQIKQRDKLFINQEHRFFSKKIEKAEEILDAMDTSNFQENHIEVLKVVEDKGIIFKLTNASISKLTGGYILVTLESELENEERVYTLSIAETYQCDKNHLENGYNLLLTQVEGAIKQLDDKVEVQRQVVEYQTTII